MREASPPRVRHVSAGGYQLIAPGELGTIKAAPSREFPLGFGRNLLLGPFCIGLCIFVGDMNNRMVVET